MMFKKQTPILVNVLFIKRFKVNDIFSLLNIFRNRNSQVILGLFD